MLFLRSFNFSFKFFQNLIKKIILGRPKIEALQTETKDIKEDLSLNKKINEQTQENFFFSQNSERKKIQKSATNFLRQNF